MGIRINRGDIEVLHITGVVEKTHFSILIECQEKYFEVSDLGDTFALCVTEGRTLRNGEVLRKDGLKGPTMVHLGLEGDPSDWHVNATTGGYCVELIGVYCPVSEAKEIEFSLAD